jgi:hypothetical protein
MLEDRIVRVSPEPKSELPNPDMLDELLLTSRNLSEFWGKTLPLFHETDRNFHLAFTGWKKASGIPLPDRIADARLAPRWEWSS